MPGGPGEYPSHFLVLAKPFTLLDRGKIYWLHLLGDHAFFLLHLSPIPMKTYSKSILQHLNNTAQSCIPLKWKNPTPYSCGYWDWRNCRRYKIKSSPQKTALFQDLVLMEWIPIFWWRQIPADRTFLLSDFPLAWPCVPQEMPITPPPLFFFLILP